MLLVMILHNLFSIGSLARIVMYPSDFYVHYEVMDIITRELAGWNRQSAPTGFQLWEGNISLSRPQSWNLGHLTKTTAVMKSVITHIKLDQIEGEQTVDIITIPWPKRWSWKLPCPWSPVSKHYISWNSG